MHPGTLIAGRYRLDDRLAAGGMGEVWRGTDTRLNRAVAVKLLHAGLSGNDRFRARFHQEAQAVAALQSPGIVALYDYGEEHSPEGLTSYLIMELVRGTSLDRLIAQRRRLSPNETLKIVASAAEALDTAHRAGIIHRDIKPGNLLIGDDGTAKIVDFGIAAGRAQAGLTETGTVMGTVAYASPEQLQGAQLTGATDIYSLGIVAYECLAGRTPFNGADPTSAITGHLTGTPDPLPPDVPQPIAQLVMRCLAKDPRQRFASAGELARACRDGGTSQGGTTAILPPGRAAAGAAATQRMPQGVVPAGTQAMPRSEFDSPPAAERDWPAPREPEEPGRSPVVPIVLTVLGVMILVVAAVWLWPRDGDPDRAGAEDTTTTEQAEDEESPEDESEETADEGSDEEEDQDEDQEQDTSDDEEQPDPGDHTLEEPQGVAVPDVTGQVLTDAVGSLSEAGFNDVGWAAESDDGLIEDEDAGSCRVETQDPTPEDGERDPDNTRVELTYWDDGEGCGV
ncbi:serine/threonine-protein kinase [Glycomyces salinus]|uniref:serine/threonine-protein kinase n=1 Tax=Glycomyces salinus TaxID=980294 RepID=UPI0018EB9862|nr:serine/threonine-protein kinase [Glycomyces salinus]